MLATQTINHDVTAVDADLSQTLYDQLRALARRKLRALRPGQTWQATELVHVAYIRMAERAALGFESRRHLLGVAARAMRDALVDHVRSKSAKKRWGGLQRVDVSITLPDGRTAFSLIEAIDVHNSLSAFEAIFPARAEVVMLSYFAGQTNAEIAELVGKSVSTVEKQLRFARAWLREHMAGG